MWFAKKYLVPWQKIFVFTGRSWMINDIYWEITIISRGAAVLRARGSNAAETESIITTLAILQHAQSNLRIQGFVFSVFMRMENERPNTSGWWTPKSINGNFHKFLFFLEIEMLYNSKIISSKKIIKKSTLKIICKKWHTFVRSPNLVSYKIWPS